MAIGYAGGLWPELQPAQLVGRNVGVQGVYIGRLLRHAPDVIAAATRELLELWSSRRIRPVVGAEFPLDDVEQAHELVESRRSVGQGRPPAVRALVTGGRGGIGSAICALLDDPLVLDLPEFDVGDPDAWRALDGEFDAAFLNAGIGIGYADVAELTDDASGSASSARTSTASSTGRASSRRG